MNWWLTIIYLLTTSGNPCETRKVLLMKHNPLEDGSKQLKKNENVFFAARISVEGEYYGSSDFDNRKRNCIFLQYTKHVYSVVDDSVTRDITSAFNSSKVDNPFIRFDFHFTDISNSNDYSFNEYDSDVEVELTFKQLKKDLEDNCFSLSNDEIKSRMCHVKQVFIGFVFVKLLKLNDHLSSLVKLQPRKLFKKKKMFKLHYFKVHSGCLESLERFVAYLKCFNLEYDKNSKWNKNMKMSTELSKRLSDKFDNDVNFQGKSRENMKVLFMKCIEHLKNEIDKKNIMFLIGADFNRDFYFNEIYNGILKIIEGKTEFYDLSSPKKDFIISLIVKYFDNFLYRLQEKSAENFFKTESFFNFFLKNVESLDDYIYLEKTICDYYNMTVFICGLKDLFSINNDRFKFLRPIIIDENDFNLVTGLEIMIKRSVFVKTIKAFYEKEKFIILEKGVHYFKNAFRNICLPYDVLKNLKIKSIEIEYSYEKNSKELEVFRHSL